MIFVNEGIAQAGGNPIGLALELAQAIKCVRGCFPDTPGGKETADKLTVFAGRLAMLSDQEVDEFVAKCMNRVESLDDLMDHLEAYCKEKNGYPS